MKIKRKYVILVSWINESIYIIAVIVALLAVFFNIYVYYL